GTDDGNVQLTRNGGESWTELSANIKGLPKGSWIPQLKASNKNKGEVLLIANDYRRFNYTPYAFRTKDYGKTWERIVDGNDVESYTLAIAQDPEEENLLFLGTDDGLYVSIDAAKSWTKWTEGFPTVPVMDLVIHPREQDLVIGTFGRAAWVLDDIRPLRALAREKSILEKSIVLFNPPTAYLASYQQPTGSRFGADAIFNGDNRDGGAHIKYYFKAESKDVEEEKNTNKKSGGKNSNSKSSEDTEKSEKKSKSDSLILNIYDGDRLIRTLKQKAPKESGIYTWNWGLDEKGVEGPSRRNFNRGNREPRGLTVLPGTYKVQLNFGEHKSETQIQVEADPRIKPSMANLKEVYNAGKELEKLMEAAGKAVKQLNENKSAANNFKKLLEEKDKKLYESQIKASKEIVKGIDSLVAIYLGKEDDRQGIIRSPEMNVGQRIGVARGYVSSRQTGLTETEKRLMNQANTAVEDAIKTTNNFFNNQWKAYTEEMDKVEIERFKPYETIKMD
ncbi:WD40/YVTN/BNR-like repeat-containing protein, partial [Aegicerativicinus sediminis]